MQTHAAIDLGTNSFHLLVARADANGRFETITKEKASVRLGSGSGDMRKLTDDAMNRGLTALRRFAQIAAAHDAPVTAVATSAVREAENRQEFLERAEEESGVKIEVISGVEEARLIHLGVLQAVPVFDQTVLVIDIGGGSTEFVVGHRGEVLEARSLKLGAIRLTDRFFPEGAVTSDAIDACRVWVRNALDPVLRDVSGHTIDVAVGSSGTISTIASIAEAAAGRSPHRMNNVSVDRAGIHGAVELLAAAESVAERRAVPGNDPGRADIITAGGILIDVIVEALDLPSVTVSEFALREGVILDQLREGHIDGLHHLDDLRRSSVLRVAELFREDRDHVVHATDLALSIFDQTQELHGLNDHDRDLLEAAGVLHNVGLFISHAAHHKHSYYVIRNSDQLLGFTDHEIELIAQIARYHRKSAPKPSHPDFMALDADDQQRVRTLSGMLRIGIGLDRTHQLLVPRVDCAIEKKRIVMTAHHRLGTDIGLELYTANERKGPFESAIDRRIDIVPG